MVSYRYDKNQKQKTTAAVYATVLSVFWADRLVYNTIFCWSFMNLRITSGNQSLFFFFFSSVFFNQNFLSSSPFILRPYSHIDGKNLIKKKKTNKPTKPNQIIILKKKTQLSIK